MLALMSFGHHKIVTKFVTIDQLYEQTKFIHGLLIKEFVLRYSLQVKSRFVEVLSLMESKNVLKRENDFVLLGPEGEPHGHYFAFYGSLAWPII
jgi:hypothetical protein